MLDRCGLVVCANAASAFPLGVRMLCEKKTRARPTRFALRTSSKIDFPGMRALFPPFGSVILCLLFSEIVNIHLILALVENG